MPESLPTRETVATVALQKGKLNQDAPERVEYELWVDLVWGCWGAVGGDFLIGKPLVFF